MTAQERLSALIADACKSQPAPPANELLAALRRSNEVLAALLKRR